MSADGEAEQQVFFAGAGADVVDDERRPVGAARSETMPMCRVPPPGFQATISPGR
jgi:hypothetical protein